MTIASQKYSECSLEKNITCTLLLHCCILFNIMIIKNKKIANINYGVLKTDIGL